MCGGTWLVFLVYRFSISNHICNWDRNYYVTQILEFELDIVTEWNSWVVNDSWSI